MALLTMIIITTLLLGRWFNATVNVSGHNSVIYDNQNNPSD